MRLVVDTNVIVSAIINPAGAPGGLLKASQNHTVQLVLAPELLRELRTVFMRPQILLRIGWDAGRVAGFLERLTQDAVMVVPSVSVSASRDPLDNHVLEAAIAGDVDYVVTGDNDLLELGEFAGIRIVTPARFSAILAEREVGR